jgi:hypothetical protein
MNTSLSSRFKGLARRALFAIAALAVTIPVPQAQAATPNYAPAYSVLVVPCTSRGSTRPPRRASRVQHALQGEAGRRRRFRARLRRHVAHAHRRREGGRHDAPLRADLRDGGHVHRGHDHDSAIADEAASPSTLTITGTSPTWNDITVILTFVRT